MATRISPGWRSRAARCVAAAIALQIAACTKSPDGVAPCVRRLAELRRAAEAPAATVAQRGELALFLHANDRIAEAEELYERLRHDDARDGRWPYYLARIRQDAGDIAGARALLEDAAARAPDYPLVELRRAELWLKSGAPDEAERSYRRYLERVPDGAHGWLGLARLALQRQAWDEAESHLAAAVRCDPALGSGHALLAGVYEARGEPRRAAEARARAEAAPRYREPDDAWMNAMLDACCDVEKLCVLADIAIEAGDVARGIVWLRRARDNAPEHARTRFALGKALLGEDQRDAGLAELREAVRLDPRLAAAHHALVAALVDAGEHESALAAATRAIEQAPGDAGLQRQRGAVLQTLGRRAEAEAALRDAVRLDPGDVQNVEALGNFLWTMQRWAEASAEFEKARALARLAVKPRALLAGYYIETQDMMRAAACLREIAEVEPEFDGLPELQALFHLRRGNALVRTGDLAAAESAFRQALTARSDHEESWTGLVAVWQRSGRSAEARRELDALLQANPAAVFAYALAAKVALQAGDRTGGLEYLERGLRVARGHPERRHEEELRRIRALVR